MQAPQRISEAGAAAVRALDPRAHWDFHLGFPFGISAGTFAFLVCFMFTDKALVTQSAILFWLVTSPHPRPDPPTPASVRKQLPCLNPSLRPQVGASKGPESGKWFTWCGCLSFSPVLDYY